jgi:hypothetical protein
LFIIFMMKIFLLFLATLNPGTSPGRFSGSLAAGHLVRRLDLSGSKDQDVGALVAPRVT